MQRRKFINTATAGILGAGAATLSGVALAQIPEFKWRLASSFPKSLDTIFGGVELIAKRVAAATGGKFQIQVFAANEIVPGGAVLDAVKDGTVQMGHTASYYYVGKDPTFAFDTAMPFGLNARQQNAWMYEGGGLALMRELFKEYNIYQIPAGNTGAQMGGWYRKEIKTVADLKGLKFRIGGIGGQVLQKLGVVPQQTKSLASIRAPSTTTTQAGGKADRSYRSISTSTSGQNYPRIIKRFWKLPVPKPTSTCKPNMTLRTPPH